MYESQQFVDLPDKASGFEDPNSWLLEDRNLSPNFSRNQPTIAGLTSGNLGHDLVKEIVEIFPLVQSLIERKPASSFTRRGSVIYTKTPSRESLSRKTTDLKGRNAGQSIAGKKKREGKHEINGSDAESFSILSSTRSTTEDREELDLLKTQLEDLQKKLLEKEESLNSAEALKNEMTSIHSELGALKVQTSEKDSLIKSTQRQLSDAKIKLADKQAALEKVQWEAMTSSSKLEKLQEELNTVQVEVSTLMFLCDKLLKTDSDLRAEDCDVIPCNADDLPFTDDLDEAEIQRMEMARESYVAALTLAKQKRDEASVAAAARARLHLQSFVFRQNLAATS